MSSIPLPALSIQPPADPFARLGEVMRIKSLAQQQQLFPGQVQAQQQGLQAGQLDLQEKQIQLDLQKQLADGYRGVMSAYTKPGQPALQQPQSEQEQPQASASTFGNQNRTVPMTSLAGPNPDGQIAAPDTTASDMGVSSTGASATGASSTGKAPSQSSTKPFSDKFADALNDGINAGTVSPYAALTISRQVLALQNEQAGVSKSQSETAIAQHKQAGDLMAGILDSGKPQVPNESPDQIYQRQADAVRQVQAQITADPTTAARVYGPGFIQGFGNFKYAGPASVQGVYGLLQARSEMLDEQSKALLNQKTAQEVQPFDDAQRVQYNAAINNNFLQQTGKPAPAEYLLQPGSGMQQLNNINKMGDTLFSSPAVAARRAGAEAWAKVGPEIATAVGSEVGKQKALEIPLHQVQRTTISGQPYIDESDLPPQSAAVMRQKAAATGLPVVSKDTADVLREIDTAKANQGYMLTVLGNKMATNPASRLWYGPANTIEKMAQTDPALAAVGTFRNAAVQSMRAVAGSKGLRMNQALVEQAIENDIPKMTDTLPIAQEKLKNLNAFLDNSVNAHLDQNRTEMVNTAQAAAAKPSNANRPAANQAAGPPPGTVGTFTANGKEYYYDANHQNLGAVQP